MSKYSYVPAIIIVIISVGTLSSASVRGLRWKQKRAVATGSGDICDKLEAANRRSRTHVHVR